MTKKSISIEGISKEYSISKGKDSFWALKDINLEVQKGKVLGLIGPNGAGKSTLLKILSRITYPSQGKVSINGRLASLLEVGTGFHPELTGRENIFLNGSILGMTRGEIKKHFDEILDFSGVHDFIDTPVKHYSSGMYVRLAFSVAAHLKSDILLIDEVLAVGDAEFQRKCLDKMSEATQAENRTVIFVSHNMGIARNLCDEIAYLDNGQIQKLGNPDEVTDFYLSKLRNFSESIKLQDRKDRKGNGSGRLTNIKIHNPDSNRDSILVCGERAKFDISFETNGLENKIELNFELHIFNNEGNYLLTLGNQLSAHPFTANEKNGIAQCDISRLPLMPGRYFIKAHMYVDKERADFVNHSNYFEVLDGDFYNSGNFYKRKTPGVLVDQDWKIG